MAALHNWHTASIRNNLIGKALKKINHQILSGVCLRGLRLAFKKWIDKSHF